MKKFLGSFALALLLAASPAFAAGEVDDAAASPAPDGQTQGDGGNAGSPVSGVDSVAGPDTAPIKSVE